MAWRIFNQGSGIVILIYGLVCGMTGFTVIPVKPKSTVKDMMCFFVAKVI